MKKKQNKPRLLFTSIKIIIWIWNIQLHFFQYVHINMSLAQDYIFYIKLNINGTYLFSGDIYIYFSGRIEVKQKPTNDTISVKRTAS